MLPMHDRPTMCVEQTLRMRRECRNSLDHSACAKIVAKAWRNHAPRSQFLQHLGDRRHRFSIIGSCQVDRWVKPLKKWGNHRASRLSHSRTAWATRCWSCSSF
jgi:hypothetical protein